MSTLWNKVCRLTLKHSKLIQLTQGETMRDTHQQIHGQVASLSQELIEQQLNVLYEQLTKAAVARGIQERMIHHGLTQPF